MRQPVATAATSTSPWSLAAIGFVEAQGLAVILAALLWRATPDRAWHVVGGAMVTLLGVSNLVFWTGRPAYARA